MWHFPKSYEREISCRQLKCHSYDLWAWYNLALVFEGLPGLAVGDMCEKMVPLWKTWLWMNASKIFITSACIFFLLVLKCIITFGWIYTLNNSKKCDINSISCCYVTETWLTIFIMMVARNVEALQWLAYSYQLLIAIWEKVVLFCRKKTNWCIMSHFVFISEIHCWDKLLKWSRSSVRNFCTPEEVTTLHCSTLN